MSSPHAPSLSAARHFGWLARLSTLSLAALAAALSGPTKCVAVPPAPYPAAVLNSGPIAYYRFSENIEVPALDTALNIGSLGASANGSYLGGATTGAEAPRPPAYIGMELDNTALRLDGINDYVGTALSLLNGKPNFTVMGWLRRATDQPARTGLFGQNDIVEFGYINNSTLECWTDNGLDVPNPFPNGEWGHVAIVQDGSRGTMTMYNNGAIAGSRASTLPADNAFKFNIGGGGIFDAGGNFFNGQLDEVAVFDKALDAENICSLYYTAVASAPILTRDLPASANLFEDGTITLCVGYCGTPPFTLRWHYFGNEIPGQTSACLTIPNATPDDSGSYHVEISNDYGTVASGFCEVTVQPTEPPVITEPPRSLTRYAGRTVTLRVQATGGAHLSYQWQLGAVNIPGANNSVLTLAGVQPANAGDYRVIVGNSAGTATSDTATLTVIVPPPGSYEQRVVDCDPIAYWRLDETSGPLAYDYIGGNDGTYNNVTLGVPGAIAGSGDTAADFDGASSSVTTVPGLMNNLAKFSIVGWIRRASDQANRTGIFGQNDLVEFGYINNNTLECWTDNGLDVSPNPLPNEQWGQLAVVSEGSPGTLTMYFNGLAIGSRPHTLPAPNNFSFNIGGGGIFDASGNFFNGTVDEVALFDRALPPEKICALYLTGSGLPLAVNIARDGNLVFDSKPLGAPHDGQNFGAAWTTSDTDATQITRIGVMQFVASESDRITVAADPDFNSPLGTIAFWMRSGGTTGVGNDGAILFDRRTDRGDVIVQQSNGQIFVQATDGAGVVNSFSTGAINDDNWHHVTYVYDQSAAGSISIYIDGLPSGSQANARAWSWPATQRIELGRSHDPYWFIYNGEMDDCRIYNRILAEAEIALIASSDDLVDPVALKLRLNFDGAPSGVTMTWPCGTLQSTEALLGNGAPTVWTDVPGAVPPYTINPRHSARFYRVRQ